MQLESCNLKPAPIVVWPRNPFHPADKDLYPVEPGSTVADWMRSQSITEFPLPTVCLVNGQPLLRRDWAIRPLATHDVVVLVGLPGGGGGGGGSNPLRVVLSIAVMVLAPYAAAGLMGYGMTAAGIAAAQAAMGTIGFGLMAAGVSVLGAFLVNALVPLPNPSVPSAQNGIAPSPTYSLQSQGNFARLLQPVPVIYGRHLVYPDLGATPYTEYINNEQYLHQLLVIGQGEYAIEAVRIEDTPIQSFSEVQAQLILPGGQNTLFNHDVVTAPEVAGQELLAIDDPANTRGETVGPFIVNPPETRIDAIGIDILLPRGLFYANDAGGQDPKEVRWTVQARAVNDSGEATTGWQILVLSTNYGAWSAWNPTWSSASAVTTQTYHYDSEGGYYSTSYGPPPLPANTPTEEYQLGDCSNQDWESGTCYAYYIQRRTRAAYPQQEVISGAYAETVRRSYRYPVTAGRYEVRVIRGDHKDTRARAGHELRWGEVRGYLVNPSLPAGITFLAVKMRATDNLSMRSSRLINCLVTRKLPTWNPSTGWSAPQATRSIAWAFADAVRASYGAKLADSRIDLPALNRLDQTWNQRGDQFDAVFDQKVTVWEALTRIARCGRAVPYLQSGVVRLVRDEPKTLPVARFTTANIVKGSFKLQYVMPGEETADAVTVEFFSPKTWKPAEVTVSLPGSTQTNPATVNLFGCTNQTQAMREGKYIAAANRYRRRLITFRTEMEGLIPTFGDLIAISHDMPTTETSYQDSGLSNIRSDLSPESSVLNYLARVMAIRPRGEQVEIACVVEHPLVHTADQ
jgi:sulfur carrier protein ThiS